jgi:recombination protein RecA
MAPRKPLSDVIKPTKAASAPTGKVSPLSRARVALKKILKGEDHVVPMSDDLLKQSIPHIPTGSIIVDYAIGGQPNVFGVSPCPGLPRGRITQLYGNNSAGKTTLALTVCASVCASGGTCAYIDWEHEVEPRYAKVLGVPIEDESKFLLIQPDTLEEGMKAMILLISEGVDLIVLDSVGAGIPEVIWTRSVEEEGTQTRVGLVASKWSEFLPKVKSAMKKSGTTILAISQLRKTIAKMGMGPDSSPQGGEAWKFYTSVRMMLRVIKKETAKRYNPLTGKVEDKTVGVIVSLKLEKCKVSSSVNNEFTFYLRSGEGIDNTRSVVELGLAHNIVQKGGAWYEWPGAPGSPLRANGMDALLKNFRENPSLVKALFNEVTPKLMASSVAVPLDDSSEDGPTPNDIDEMLAVVTGSPMAAALAEAEAEEDDCEVVEVPA